jgi:hypothetical protein
MVVKVSNPLKSNHVVVPLVVSLHIVSDTVG